MLQVQYSVAIALSEHNLHGLQFYHFRRLAILLGFQFYHFRRLTIQKQETRHLAHPIFQTSIGKMGIAQIANIDLHGLHFATLGVLDKKNGMPYASRSANPQSTSTKLRSYRSWTPWFTILPHSELYVTKQKRMGCLACPILSTLDRRARNSGVTHHGLHGL